MSLELSDEAVLALHPLHFGEEENGAREVGRPDTGTFVALPEEGVALLEWLAAGIPVGEIRRRFEERFGALPDLEDFLTTVAECGFLRSTPALPERGSQSGAAAAEEPRPPGVALLGGLPSSWVGWLLSRPMRLLYLGIWLAVPAILLTHPGLRPAPADAFLTHDVLANVVLVALLAWTLVFLHELAHAVAVRALGCTGRLSLSRRLWFLVAQTEMSAVRTAPRKRRYAAYLAGMTWDVAVMLACLLLEMAGVAQLARTVVYTLTLSLVFQFSVFMRTDVYYVLANWLRLGNLMEDTRHVLANLAHRALGRRPPHDMGEVPARELTAIRWYLPYYLIGSTAVTAGFALLTVPALKRMVAIALSHLAAGPLSIGFWDGLGFLAVAGFQFGMLAFVTVRDRRRGSSADSRARADVASAISLG